MEGLIRCSGDSNAVIFELPLALELSHMHVYPEKKRFGLWR